MKRALIAASVASMIDQFNMPNIRLLLELGYEVDVAANFTFTGSITKERADEVRKRLSDMGVNVYDVPVPRRILAVGDILKSYRMIKGLSRKREYSLMHCHSPIGGAIARAAVRRERRAGKTKSIYTAHGFHFYKGAPKKNWLVFYPVEKLCARMTDVLITINREDFAFAKRKLKAKRVEYIPGVGIDPERFLPTEKSIMKRSEIGVPGDAKMLLSVGELNKNKNHEKVIRAIAELKRDDVHYAIAGKGALADDLTRLAEELGIAERVHILGYRDDVDELYGAADLFVHPSYREGLPVSVIEAMAAGLPVVASRIRGNVDLITEEGGRLVCPCNVRGFAEAIDTVLSDAELSEKMGLHNREAAKNYSTEAVSELLSKLYG